MAEKSKAKKAKTISKKTSTKVRKAEPAPVVEVEEEIEVAPAPVIKRAKIGKIIARSTRPDVDSDLADQPTDEVLPTDRPPPLESKFASTDVQFASEGNTVESKQPMTPKIGQDNSEQLHIKLSRSLTRKLKDQAADEGIGLDEFISELLSESVVLRAWEIVERKNQMKGGPALGNTRSNHSGNGQQQNRHNNSMNSNQRNNSNKSSGHRGMNHSRYQNIMEDKASFLEYVRSQERNRR
ncbi:MAG: hypothetical protein NTX25_22010 [Proteobacteria bacterium]|nr:hypothetical protein [Pseudomonadota bacterium]